MRHHQSGPRRKLRDRKRRSRLEQLEQRRMLTGYMALTVDDPVAAEPLQIYCDGLQEPGFGGATISVPAEWGGGDMFINLGGSALYDDDYDLTTGWGTPSVNGNVLKIEGTPSGPYDLDILLEPRGDRDETESAETVTFAWVSGQSTSSVDFTVVGDDTVTIDDLQETITFSASPASTQEGDSQNPAIFHINPGSTGYDLCADVILEIDASGFDDADFGTDYWISHDESPYVSISWKPPVSGIYESYPFRIENDNDFQLSVIAAVDSYLEGLEYVRASVRPYYVDGQQPAAGAVGLVAAIFI